MKAVIIKAYGGTDVLHIAELPRPSTTFPYTRVMYPLIVPL